MKAKDFRKQAWSSLRGNWGVMILCLVIYSVITGLLSYLSRYGIGAALLLIVSGPFAVGNYKMSLNLIRGEKVDIPMLFYGFKDANRTVILGIINYIFIFLWSLLLVIPGIIKKYAYSMSYFILMENPELGANEARKRSIQLMKGNKWRLFCLHLSYIGWYLLCIITCGILSLWVIPSIQTAEAAFYNSLVSNGTTNDDSSDVKFDDAEVVDVDVDTIDSSNDNLTF